MKTTGVVGSVQIICLLFALIRNKIIALYFGTAGLGIWGLYLSFTEMIKQASSLGLEKSGVKQIAENHVDVYKRDLTIQVVQFSLAIFSLICSIIAAIFATEFSQNIFGTSDYRNGILICCLVIFLNSLLSAFNSILNGLGEIKKLAYSQLMGVISGNVIVFFLIPFWGKSAIPFYLLIIAVCTFIPSFIYVRKLKIPSISIFSKEAFQNLSLLMKIGFAFWAAAVFMGVTNYLINIFLMEQLSVEVVGIYQASWAISNLYVGIILSSMGVAFFPKICRAMSNKDDTRAIINEQIEFGLLVSFPFIVGIFIFAPYILTLLYSSEFASGASMIRWQMLGVAFRLLGFPFGYALMAKGKAFQYTLSQFIFHALNYIFIMWLVINVGFKGLGVNYLISYFIYMLIVGWFCHKELDYKISSFLVKIFTVYLIVIGISGVVVNYFTGFFLVLFGCLIFLISSYYSYRELDQKLDVNVIAYLKGKLKM